VTCGVRGVSILCTVIICVLCCQLVLALNFMPNETGSFTHRKSVCLLLLLLLHVKINVALSENASSTWYTIKIELKLTK